MQSWIGLALELASLAVPLSGTRDPWAMAAFVAMHAGATALLAPAAWLLLPARMREPKAATVATLALLNLFVPMLLAGLLAALWLGTRLRRPPRSPAIVAVESPEFTSTRERDPSRARAGQVRARLTSFDAPASARLGALLAIQDAPGRITADILRELLADPTEDVRLLAYGLLDRKEKEIGRRVLDERAALDALRARAAAGLGAPAPDALYRAHKRLAELNWELVYQRLVQGDLLAFTAREAWRHAREAVALRADDAGLWYLLGRIGLEADEPVEGRLALERAAALDHPRERIVPWLAEYAFRERDFERVRELFASLRTVPESMRTAAAYQFWRY